MVDWVAPTPVVSLVGFPARFEREKLAGVAASLPEAAGFSLPDPPERSLPETAAVAVNEPAVPFAVRSGELATPDAPVVAVASVPPSVKLAPALEVIAARARAAGAERECDRRPGNGVPPESSTLTCSGWG